MSRKTRLRGTAIAIGVVLALLAGEAIARLRGRGDNLHTTATLGLYRPDPLVGWALAPDLNQRRRWIGRDVTIRTDHQGHRIPAHDETRGEGGAIVFAGDSYVFGNEVDAEETFVELVGGGLGGRPVNLGVGGYGLSQGSMTLGRHLSADRDVELALFVIYVGNDLESGLDAWKVARVDESGRLLRGGPSRWASLRSFALRHCRLCFDLDRLLPRLPVQMQPPNAPAQPRWIYDAGALDRDSVLRDRVAGQRQALAALRGRARESEVLLIVMLLPEHGQVYGELGDLPNRRLDTMLAELGIPKLDVLPELRAAAATRPDLWHDVVGGHLSTAGHRVVADAVLARLRTLSTVVKP